MASAEPERQHCMETGNDYKNELENGDCHAIRSHPKFNEIVELGMTDFAAAQDTLMVYLNLVEGKGWWNVTLCWSGDLEQVFICGHPTRTQERESMLPISSDKSVSMEMINKYIQASQVCTKCSGLTLGILDSESNIVYYKLSAEIVRPEHPDMIDAKKRRRKRKFERRKYQFVNFDEASAVAREAKEALLGPSQTETAQTSAVSSDQINADTGVRGGDSSVVIENQAGTSAQSSPGGDGRNITQTRDHHRHMLPEDFDDENYSDESDAYADEL